MDRERNTFREAVNVQNGKKNEKIFFSDLGHFNNYGNEIFGKAVFKQLKNYQDFNF